MRVDRGTLGVAVAVMVLGAFVLSEGSDSSGIRATAEAGPAFLPMLTGAGFLVLGLALAVVTFARRAEAPDEEAAEQPLRDASAMDWRAALLLASGIIAYVALIRPVGVAIAGGALLGLVAFAFRSAHPWRDTTIGLLIAILAYVVFTAGLGFSLSAEPLPVVLFPD